MDYGNIDLGEIPKLLVEKHKRLLAESKTAYENIGRIRILEEKIDQLSNWLKDSKGKKQDAYSKRYESTKAELQKLKGDATLPSKISGKELEQKIRDHEKALDYWKTQ